MRASSKSWPPTTAVLAIDRDDLRVDCHDCGPSRSPATATGRSTPEDRPRSARRPDPASAPGQRVGTGMTRTRNARGSWPAMVEERAARVERGRESALGGSRLEIRPAPARRSRDGRPDRPSASSVHESDRGARRRRDRRVNGVHVPPYVQSAWLVRRSRSKSIAARRAHHTAPRPAARRAAGSSTPRAGSAGSSSNRARCRC